MRPALAGQIIFGFAKTPKRRGPKRTKESGVAHVTIKLKDGLPSLRNGDALAVVMAAIDRVKQGKWVRIVHFSIQSNHVHLIVTDRKSKRGADTRPTGA